MNKKSWLIAILNFDSWTEKMKLHIALALYFCGLVMVSCVQGRAAVYEGTIGDGDHPTQGGDYLGDHQLADALGSGQQQGGDYSGDHQLADALGPSDWDRGVRARDHSRYLRMVTAVKEYLYRLLWRIIVSKKGIHVKTSSYFTDLNEDENFMAGILKNNDMIFWRSEEFLKLAYLQSDQVHWKISHAIIIIN